MKTTTYSRSSQSRIPGFDQNAVLQLIVASGVGYITYHLIWVFIKLGEPDSTFFFTGIRPNVVLPLVQNFPAKFWTIFLYGWTHSGFWEMFSNMIWLYVFGNVVQMLVSYRQVIPIFIYGLVAGGLFYELAQLIPGGAFIGRPAMLGAQGGIMALSVAALVLAPGYRYYLTPNFSIPLVAIACIFFALMVMNANVEGAALSLLAGGALAGFGYAKLLQNGYKPGNWMYGMFDRMNNIAEPDGQVRYRHNVKRKQVLSNIKEATRRNIDEARIDDILDKINQKGYNSLTKEEREILERASKDKQ
jgi:membrane associated rhomboid family serine protease